MLMFQADGTTDTEGGTGAQDKKVITGDILTTPFSEGVIGNVLNLEFGKVADYFKGIGSKIIGASGIYETSKFLDSEQAKLRGAVGLGSQKADEFKKLVADGAAKFAAVGLSTADVGKTYLELANVFQTDISISDQNLVELGATAKVTGQSTKELAEGFRGVGISIQEVGENMTDVAKIAREAGVSITAVSAQVVKNLDKMNIYNFENGVKGLSKMAAQATKLGIDMDKIFHVVDQAFNPESAIEMAAAMQRLGVSTGALLDPLRLMDLSQNDPTELQNQIVNMSKDFVRFNKELGQFEIMPGEKRRLNEIGKALGMTNGELQKMALNAAGLDMKMKQIRFPSSIASKEDRELIATLATVNKQGVAEIKIAKTDEKGNKTGEYEMVEASQLTVEQLQRIKEDQELQGQSMEEIAFNQLDELTKLNTQFKSFVEAVGMGVASRKEITRAYDVVTKGTRKTVFGEGYQSEEGAIKPLYRQTQTYREMPVDAAKITELGKALFDDFGNLFQTMGNVDLTKFNPDDYIKKIGDIGGSIGGMLDELKNKVMGEGSGGTNPNKPAGGTNQNASPSVLTTSGEQKITNQNLNQNINKITFDPLKIEGESKVTMEIKLPPELANNTALTTEIQKWFEDVKNRQTIINQLESFLTNNNLTKKK